MSNAEPENDFQTGPDPWAAHAGASRRARRRRQLTYRLGFLALLSAGVAVGFFLLGEGGTSAERKSVREVAAVEQPDVAPTSKGDEDVKPEPQPPVGEVTPREPMPEPPAPMPEPPPEPTPTPPMPAPAGRSIGDPTEYVGHTAAIQSVAVSADGQQLLSLGGDKTLRLWQVGQPEPVFSHKVEEPPIGVGFAKDGHLLLATEGEVFLINPDGGATVRSYVTPRGNYMAMAVVADGSRFVTASNDGTLRVWSVEAVEPVIQFDLPVSQRDVQATSVAVTPAGDKVVGGYSDGSILLWDIALESRISGNRIRDQQTDAVAVTADATLIASVNADRKVRVWGPQLQRPLNGTTEGEAFGLAAAFSPDKSLLAYVGTGDRAIVWDFAGNDQFATLSIPGGANAVVFGPNTSSLLIGGRDNVLRHYPITGSASAAE